MDEDKADKSLDAEAYKDFEQNAQLRAIITSQKARKLSITVGDVEIFIKAGIPKKERDALMKIAKEYKDGEIEEADKSMYVVLSNICLDSPFNNPLTWAYIDNETGEVPNMLAKITEKIFGMEAVAKRFR
jgi:hypothetical protein